MSNRPKVPPPSYKKSSQSVSSSNTPVRGAKRTTRKAKPPPPPRTDYSSDKAPNRNTSRKKPPAPSTAPPAQFSNAEEEVAALQRQIAEQKALMDKLEKSQNKLGKSNSQRLPARPAKNVGLKGSSSLTRFPTKKRPGPSATISYSPHKLSPRSSPNNKQLSAQRSSHIRGTASMDLTLQKEVMDRKLEEAKETQRLYLQKKTIPGEGP